MPPITENIPKGTCVPAVVLFFSSLTFFSEDGDLSDDDDDLEVGGVTQDYKCPLSLTTIVDPMTA